MHYLFTWFYIFLWLDHIGYISASNWAQTTGDVSQNVVVPQIPKPAHPHWNKRYGMAIVAVDDPNNPDDVPHIYLLGGDTYDGDTNGATVRSCN
jgi:hypothetical protein